MSPHWGPSVRQSETVKVLRQLRPKSKGFPVVSPHWGPNVGSWPVLATGTKHREMHRNGTYIIHIHTCVYIYIYTHIYIYTCACTVSVQLYVYVLKNYCTETVHHFHLQMDESYTRGSPTPQPMLRERLPRRPRETPRGSGLWKVPYMRVFKIAPGKALTTSLAGVVARLRAPVLLRSRRCVPVTCAAASPCVTRPCL